MSNAGNQPYTPTCLEWLALELNVEYGVGPLLPHPGNFYLSFNGRDKKNTLVIHVARLTNVDENLMNNYLETVKPIIQQRVDELGWSSWLLIDESISITEKPLLI